MAKPLEGRGRAGRGCNCAAGRGIAVQLGAAGATVYVTGRTTRAHRSEMNRPETIEETAELVDKAGGCGIAVEVDHLVLEEVRELVQRIEAEQAALHILVNDIWGATKMEWGRTVWESDLDYGLRTLRLGVDTHAITSHFALPLLIAVGRAGRRGHRRNRRIQRRDLSGLVLLRSRQGRGAADGIRIGARA